MREGNIFIKYGPGDVVHITGPYMDILLYPGFEAHLKFSIYEKEKEKK